MAGNKILTTFGVGATPASSTTTWTVQAQQVTIVNFGNPQFPINIILGSQGIRVVRGATAAGILISDLLTAMATLEPTLAPPPFISVNPTPATVQYSTATSFTITAVSIIALTYQWQVSTDGGNNWTNLTNTGVYTNSTTATLNISSVTGLNAYQYRCVATNATASTNSKAALLTVIPDITAQPGNTSVVHPNPATFSVTATGTATLTYQWQVSTDAGVTWASITAAGTPTYSNWTTATLTVGVTSTTAPAMSGYKYRVIVTDGNGQLNTSNGAATLTVT